MQEINAVKPVNTPQLENRFSKGYNNIFLLQNENYTQNKKPKVEKSKTSHRILFFSQLIPQFVVKCAAIYFYFNLLYRTSLFPNCNCILQYQCTIYRTFPIKISLQQIGKIFSKSWKQTLDKNLLLCYNEIKRQPAVLEHNRPAE